MKYQESIIKIVKGKKLWLLNLFSIIAMMSSVSILAQSTNLLLKKQLISFFDPLRENVFLHLNKTTFLKGETIWFTSYVYNQSAELPSLTTNNLHVAIYNSQGLEIDRKLIRIEQGIGYGHFNIDDDFTSTKYIIKAWTGWMKNFKDVKAYSQDIKIIHSLAIKNFSNNLRDSVTLPTVSIFPEGGNFISSMTNNIGFFITITNSNANPIKSISLIDNLGNTVVDDITFDSFGYGKFEFNPERSKHFQLKLKFDDNTEILKNFPSVIETGMNIGVESISSSYINLSINTNTITMERESGNVHFLLFRKNNGALIQELILDSTKTLVKVPKNLVFDGMNVVTLLNGNLVPQSERIFFNDKKFNDLNTSLNLDIHYSRSRDSIVVKVSHKDLVGLAQLSVSVLPLKSKAYNPKENIVSSFVILPFLSDEYKVSAKLVLNDRQAIRSKDIQLLMNGGGNYSWQTIQDGNLKMIHPFESGIELSGKVLDANLANEKQVLFFAKNGKNAFYTTLKEDKSFVFNEKVYKGDTLLVSILGEKGKLRKPTIQVNFKSSNSVGQKTYLEQGLIHDLSPEAVLNPTDVFQDQTPTIELEEVVVQGKRYGNRGSFLGQANHAITKEDSKRYKSLAVYLRRLGFRVSLENSRMVVSSNRHPYPVLPIFVNGLYTDGSELIGLPLDNVSNISYDSNSPKAISISTDGRADDTERKKNYEIVQVIKGYATSIPFERATYFDVENMLFAYYGAIHWDPNLIIKDNQESILSFPLLGHKDFIIYFEGLDSKGHLISQKQSINLN